LHSKDVAPLAESNNPHPSQSRRHVTFSWNLPDANIISSALEDWAKLLFSSFKSALRVLWVAMSRL
jgi:hypothetical protein